MAGRQTSARARTKDGEVQVHQTTTDSPLLPIEQISRLKDLAPDRVDWIFQQTEIESDFRRAENKRINTMTFCERLAGLIFALLVALLGLGVSAYLAMNDKDVVAGIIGGATLVGLVTAFIAGRRS